jgi:opacity protein-like surface antigen
MRATIDACGRARPLASAARLSMICVALGAAPLPATALGWAEAGGFVGYHEPVEQEDASGDVTFGARLRARLAPGFYAEPAITYYRMDRGLYRVRSVPQEVEPWYIASGSVSVIYGPGFDRPGYHPYVTLGAGVYFLRKAESPDADRPGYRVGAGLVTEASPNFTLDVAATAVVIALEQGGSRGILDIGVGLSYRFGGH